MRFSISLLTVICIASVIGTVVKQHEPFSNYVNQFGPFWAEVFAKVGLFSVYSVWWFLLILTFLVISTSLCIVRNVPKIITDLRTFKESVREQALASFHHKGQGALRRNAGTRPRTRRCVAGARRLEGQGAGSHERHDDRRAPRRGQQARLHRRAFGDRARLSGRAARR